MLATSSSPPSEWTSPSKEAIRQIFDGIACRYDRMNSLLSFSLDEHWRRRAVRLTLQGFDGRTLLDLGVGTGKFLKRFVEARAWERAVGVDFAGEMLRRARSFLPVECELLQADIHELPFADHSFDLILSSFTLRSVKERDRFFAEVRRVLTPRGRVAFLCLTRPHTFWGRLAYTPYLRIYLPLVGGLLTRNLRAYRFLSDSIQTFPEPSGIGVELQALGFHSLSIVPFTFGVSTLILANR